MALGGCYDVEPAPFLEREVVEVPSVEWAEALGGEGTEWIDLDVWGNSKVAVAGTFQRELLLDADSSPTTKVSTASDTDQDGFVARYDAGAGLQWVRQLGAVGAVSIGDVAALTSNAIAVTGSYSDVITFGVGTEAPIALSAGRGQGLFLASFDPAGAVAWALSEGSTGWDASHALTVTEGADPLLVIGGATGDEATFGEGMDTVVLDHLDPNNPQAFLAAYRQDDGELSWVAAARGESEITDLAVLSDQVLAVGWFTGEVSFRSATGSEERTVTTDADKSAFLVAYDWKAGSVQWVSQTTGYGETAAWSVAAIESGQIAVAGTFDGGATFRENNPIQLETESGDTDVFLASYELDTPDGQVVGATVRWVQRAMAGGKRDYCGEVVLRADGSTLLTGAFDRAEAVAGGAAGTSETLTSAGFEDGFLSLYDAAGRLTWTRRLGGSGPGDSAYSLALATEQAALLAGNFYKSLSFGADDAGPMLLESEGNDAYILRLALDPERAATDTP
ncbi:MAG: hypothetical protein JRI55_33400 [Deltaproteobacteria bacterium]|jgi:hypothetical protein|nr:hypothetical protein [Deltaproteobacteria bacterium]